MGVEYMQLVPVLIKATQEQQAIINQQKEEIVEIKTKYDQLLKRIEQLENGKPR